MPTDEWYARLAPKNPLRTRELQHIQGSKKIGASKGRGCKRESNTPAMCSPIIQLAARESSSEALVTG